MSTIKNPSAFECVACRRCGGTGEFWYRSMYGKHCFACRGTGYKHTKRGLAAANFFKRLLCKRADELRPGDKIRVDGFVAGSFVQPTKWYTVLEVRLDQPSNSYSEVNGVRTSDPNVCIVDCDGYGLHAPPDTYVRVMQTKEAKQNALARALEFQASLTKQGAPRRVAA